MIHHGDLFDVLPALDAESIDACVTDGPYGIGFMSKKWDTFKPQHIRTAAAMKQRKNPEQLANLKNVYGRKRSPAQSPSQIAYDYSVGGLREFQAFTEQWASEVLRVLKPGAYIVSCGAPRSHHRMMCGLEDAGFVVRDCFAWLFGSGFPKNHNLGDGKGTALKPAHEPIALAWKPFKGSIKACHETHGTAALNIEACRVEGTARDFEARTESDGWRMHKRVEPWEPSELGRWPANVLLDEEAAEALDAQSGLLSSGAYSGERSADKFRAAYGRFTGTKTEAGHLGSVGGASRFYYVAKPSREERDFGCHPRGNSHPTVKPIELTRWLVRLVAPINGLVLDPFTGSGTTGMACVYEQRRFVGIEREAEYVAIAERRIRAVAPLFSDDAAQDGVA